MTDREEIASALEDAARSLLKANEGKAAFPGWFLVFRYSVQFIAIGGSKIPMLSDAEMEELLELAKNNIYAFDAAKYIAGLQIVAEIDMPVPLRLFVGRVLTAEIARPQQSGRPLADDVLIKTLQYSLAILTIKNSELSLSRNDVNSTFSACDAVAEAFTRAGKYTTFAQVKSICYDPAYSDIRALGAWINDGQFFDMGRDIKFKRLEK